MELKLYTEEQVHKIKEIVKMSVLKGENLVELENRISNMITPIELPSDEEIEEEAYYKVSDHTENPYASFKSGAKWMKEQILNQNK